MHRVPLWASYAMQSCLAGHIHVRRSACGLISMPVHLKPLARPPFRVHMPLLPTLCHNDDTLLPGLRRHTAHPLHAAKVEDALAPLASIMPLKALQKVDVVGRATGVSTLQILRQGGWMVLYGVVGTVVYVLLGGVVFMTLYTALYCWAAKVLYSLYNLAVRPIVDMARRARRLMNTRVTAVPSMGQQRSAITVGPSDTAGRHQGAAGDHLHVEGRSEHVSATGMQAAAARVTMMREVAAAAARARWRQAAHRVLRRYLSQGEIVRAIAASSFASQMSTWGIKVRSVRQCGGPSVSSGPHCDCLCAARYRMAAGSTAVAKTAVTTCDG